MHKDIENIIKKWLKKHKDDGQWVSDYDGEFDLDSCCLDGDFDLNDLADEVLKVVVGNERKWIEDNWINFYESSKPLADFKKELLRKLNLLSPNKENKK